MRVGLFADVHGNLEALKSVIQLFKKKNVKEYICAGDLVGYGPSPNECIDEIRKLNALVVCGNHDAASCGRKDITWFNPDAQRAIIWTRKKISEKNRLFLTNLPKIIKSGDITVVHGSPRDYLDEYLITTSQMDECQDLFETPICIVGHSHIPFVYQKGKNIRNLFIKNLYDAPFTISEDSKYIINVGSVGQPRDGIPHACCAIYNVEKKEVTFFRVEYKIEITQAIMKKERLPAYLIERLSWGR